MVKMVNTLVIGGAGFIGSHLLPELLASGRRVTVLGRRAAPDRVLPPGVDYVSGDFAQLDVVGRLLDGCQEVVHLAYATVPNTSFDNPLADLLQNLPPTEELFLEVARRGVKLLLVSSGGTVYGEATSLPITETHPSRPISPYGVTKLTLENYAYLCAVTRGLKYVCVRPANAYGPGQRPFIGQGFVATAMASAMHGKPITIFGERGTIRDYVYISDFVRGLVAALDGGQLSTTYNLGSGTGLSNLDVVDHVRRQLAQDGRGVQVEHLPARPFDVQVNVLDSGRLRMQTGWRAEVDFDEGLQRTHEWLKQVLHG